MTGSNNREIAQRWFEIMKSAPYADFWNIEDSFVEKLAAAWPWITVYFELLDIARRAKNYSEADFSQAATSGIYALQQTLDLRFDCASALFLLFLIGRLRAQISPDRLEQCAEAIDRLVKSETRKVKGDEWTKWFEGLWEGGTF
jgi:hypothetical protein